MSQIQTRNYFLTAKERFGFKNTCVVSKLEVKRSRYVRNIQLCINGVKFDPTSSDTQSFFFDMQKIRENCRDALGLSEEETTLIAIESTFMYNQLKAIQYYTKLSKAELNNSVFTSELMVYFIVTATCNIEKIEVTETSFKSDVVINKELEDSKKAQEAKEDTQDSKDTNKTA